LDGDEVRDRITFSFVPDIMLLQPEVLIFNTHLYLLLGDLTRLSSLRNFDTAVISISHG
jgi:hypothetical protein